MRGGAARGRACGGARSCLWLRGPSPAGPSANRSPSRGLGFSLREGGRWAVSKLRSHPSDRRMFPATRPRLPRLARGTLADTCSSGWRSGATGPRSAPPLPHRFSYVSETVQQNSPCRDLSGSSLLSFRMERDGRVSRRRESGFRGAVLDSLKETDP